MQSAIIKEKCEKVQKSTLQKLKSVLYYTCL